MLGGLGRPPGGAEVGARRPWSEVTAGGSRPERLDVEGKGVESLGQVAAGALFRDAGAIHHEPTR